MKPALVFIPGLLCDADLWQYQLAHLAAVADCQVADHGSHSDIHQQAQAILDAAPARFALAGLSMGGYLALEILRLAPERVERVALLNTSARADTEQQRTQRLEMIALAGRGRFLGVSHALLPRLVAAERVGDHQLARTIMAMARHAGRDVFIRQQQTILSRPDSRPSLAAIRCPVLVLGGQQDQMTPPELQHEIAAAIPQARLLLLEHCGHLAPLEQPEVVNQALLQWLTTD